MNRNAARHLALVVSILLCFFVYMGYRFWGRGETAPEPESASETAWQPSPGAVSGLPAPSDSGSLAPPAGLRPPSESTGASDVSIPLSPRESSGFSLSPPPSDRNSSSAPAPVGSIEETAAAIGSSGGITGLIPAPPVNPSASAGAASLPDGEERENAGLPIAPPGGGLSLAPPDDAVSSGPEPPSSLSPPPSPGSARPNGVSLAPPPAAGSAPAGRAGESPVGAGGMRPPVPGGNVAPVPQRQNAAPAQSTRPPAVYDDTAGQETRNLASSTPPGVDEPVSESLRIYVVQPGDTLSRIATRELGSIALADNIFLLNRDVIADPDHLLAGVRIRLPVRASLGAGPAARGADRLGPAPIGQPSVARIHRVQRGDTLSSIALQYYGSSSEWRAIFEANRDVLPNPNQLRVGMELTIPPLGGN